MSKESKLTNRQLLMILNILSSASVEEACKKARISRATYYLWAKDEAFTNELKCQRDAILNDSLNQLKSASTKAVFELIKLMDSERETVRHSACKDVIEYVLKVKEIEGIEERLEKLEKAINNR